MSTGHTINGVGLLIFLMVDTIVVTNGQITSDSYFIVVITILSYRYFRKHWTFGFEVVVKLLTSFEVVWALKQ